MNSLAHNPHGVWEDGRRSNVRANRLRRAGVANVQRCDLRGASDSEKREQKRDAFHGASIAVIRHACNTHEPAQFCNPHATVTSQ